MALLNILCYPDPRLHKVAKPVTEFDDKLRALVADMIETMYAAPGVGLAANQIGLSRRFAVIDIKPDGQNRPLVIINPVVESRSGTEAEEEGCLSIPAFSAKVKRATKVRVRALNEYGLPVVIEGSGLLARCLQHEIDHLDGRFYIDHVPLLKRLAIKRQIARLKRANLF